MPTMPGIWGPAWTPGFLCEPFAVCSPARGCGKAPPPGPPGNGREPPGGATGPERPPDHPGNRAYISFAAPKAFFPARRTGRQGGSLYLNCDESQIRCPFYGTLTTIKNRTGTSRKCNVLVLFYPPIQIVVEWIIIWIRFGKHLVCLKTGTKRSSIYL